MKRINQLKVLLNDEELAILRQYAKENGTTMSDAVREAILKLIGEAWKSEAILDRVSQLEQRIEEIENRDL